MYIHVHVHVYILCTWKLISKQLHLQLHCIVSVALYNSELTNFCLLSSIVVSSPNSPKSPQSTSTNSAAHSQSASTCSEFGSIKKPSNLTLQNKHVSSDDSDPNSPMNNPTFDSGKDSIAGSDFSSLSAASSDQQQPDKLISFDSSTESRAAFQVALEHFDPLYPVATDETVQPIPLRQTPSYDSLLMDPRGGTTSGNVSPSVCSTSPNLRRQTSPRSSLIRDQTSSRSLFVKEPQPAARNSPIARPRPRPGKLNSYTSETGPATHHRPLSPSYKHHRKSDVSPSGSVQSLFVGFGYDSDYGAGGFQSDSDATSITSTHSSLLDLRHEDEEMNELQSPLMPTPASLGTISFDFDLRNFWFFCVLTSVCAHVCVCSIYVVYNCIYIYSRSFFTVFLTYIIFIFYAHNIATLVVYVNFLKLCHSPFCFRYTQQL